MLSVWTPFSVHTETFLGLSYYTSDSTQQKRSPIHYWMRSRSHLHVSLYSLERPSLESTTPLILRPGLDFNAMSRTSLQSHCPGSSSYPLTSSRRNEFRVQSSSLHHWTTTRCKSRIDWDTGSVNGLQRCAVGVDSVCCKQEALLSHNDSLMQHPGPPKAMLTIPAWHILNKWKASA